MAENWALTGKFLLKAKSDIGSNISEEELANLCGYSVIDEYKKAIEKAPLIKNPEPKKTPTGETIGENIYIPFYCVINDALVQTNFDKGANAYMTQDCFEKNYRGTNASWENWEEVDDDDEIKEYGFDQPMMVWNMDWMIYVDDRQPVETDDILEFHGIKKHHIDPESPFL